jgi:hypothetical protein
MISVVICLRFAKNFEIYMQNFDKQQSFRKGHYSTLRERNGAWFGMQLCKGSALTVICLFWQSTVKNINCARSLVIQKPNLSTKTEFQT